MTQNTLIFVQLCMRRFQPQGRIALLSGNTWNLRKERSKISFFKKRSSILSYLSNCILAIFLISTAEAAIIGHYDFRDNNLLDNELSNTYSLTHRSNGGGQAVSFGNLGEVYTAVFPGGATSNSWLECAGPGNISDFTVSFWFQTDAVNQGEDYLGLFSSGDNVAGGNWQLNSDASIGGRLVLLDGNNTRLEVPTAHSANTWYHVVIRKDIDASQKTLLYLTPLGGNVGDPVVSSASSTTTLAKLRIGVNRASNQSYRMQASNIRIYDDSDVSITQLFEEGPIAEERPEITLFKADDHYVEAGDNFTLHWETLDTTNWTISPNIGDVTNNTANQIGSISTNISETTVFTLNAINGDQTTSQTLRVEVGPARPNFIMYLLDDYGPQDTSVPFNLDENGDPKAYNFNSFYKTPNVETLAANGMRFTTAYAQSVCSPTRCGILSGRNSIRHGVTDWVGSSKNTVPQWRNSGFDGNDVTLPKQLQAAGYRTIHIGKGHFGKVDIISHGFDVNVAGNKNGHPPVGYIGTAGYNLPGLESYNGREFLTQVLAIEANQQIEAASEDGVPFFLYLPFYAVHSPFTRNPNATGDYSSGVSGSHREFATMVEGVDLAIGAIQQKLIDLGIAEDTLIIFLGDNGSDSPATNVGGLPQGQFSDWPMRGKKGSKWEGGCRVPLITSWGSPNPSNLFQQNLPIPVNSIETDIVTSWDLPATVLDIAGLTPVDNFGEDSFSLAPYMRGEDGTHRPQEIYIHYPHEHRSDYFSWVRAGKMKLIYNFANATHQLYNLEADPTESNELSAAMPETTTRLARKLAQYIDATWEETEPLFPPQFIIDRSPKGENLISIPENSAVDLDNDGLADSTEDTNQNGLVDADETNPDAEDTDGDSTLDGVELKLGLDPLNSAESFRLNIFDDDDGGYILSWPSAPSNVFRIETSGNLTQWITLSENEIANPSGTTSSYEAVSESANRFFRVTLK